MPLEREYLFRLVERGGQFVLALSRQRGQGFRFAGLDLRQFGAPAIDVHLVEGALAGAGDLGD